MQTPTRFPPRLVPTLTDVVHLPDADNPVNPAPSVSEGLQDQLVQSVMLRVDAILSKRLHEAVAELVHTQTALMVPMLQQQIEVVVREAVVDALAASQSTPQA